jgi:hypothetical protein
MHNQVRRTILSLMIFALAALLACVPMLAQGAPEGRIAGVVHDPTGAVIPGASILVTNSGTGAQYTATAGAEGGFLIPALPAGAYTVKISANGFTTGIYSDVKVDAAKEYSLTAVLKVGSTAETVEVSAGQDLVSTTSSELSQTVSSSQVANLPLNGRDVITLLQTQPGVAAGGGNARSGIATSINGTRPSWSQVTLDGINIQDLYIRTNALDYIPFRSSTEQVQEFTVNTSTQGANAALGANGVYMVTRSGSNAFHGGVYEFNRNSALAANSWFNNHANPVVPIPFLNRNEFGGNFGGPVWKNKLFFYGHYEGLRTRSSGQTNRTVPLNSDYIAGVYRYIGATDKQPHAVNVMTGVGLTSAPATALSVDPKIQSLFLSRADSPSKVNNTDVGDALNTAGYRFNEAANNDRNTWGFKLDYELSARHHLDFALTHLHETTLRNDLDPVNVIPKVTNDSSPKLFVGSWRWTVSSSLVNNLRVGANLVNAPFLVNQKNTNGFIWDQGTRGSKGTVTGIALSSPDITFMPQGRNPAIHQYADDATWVKGTHAFSFGGSFQNQNIYSYGDGGILPTVVTGFSAQSPASVQLASAMFPGGISSTALSAANGLRAFIGGVISSESQTFNVKDKTSGFVAGQTQGRNLRLKDMSLYGQDRWRIASNLTLTYGVKWEYLSPYDERDGLMVGPVYTNSGNPISTLLDPNGSVDFLKQAWTPQWHNFAPTVGLAWDPFKNGKTSVRAGYTLTYVNDDQYRFAGNAADGNAGLTSTVNLLQNGSSALYYPGSFGSIPAVAAPAFKMPRTYADQLALSTTNVVWALDPNIVTPKVHLINFSVERQVGSNMSFAARYVGTLGRDLLRGVDLNQTNAGTNQAYLADFTRARTNGYLSQAAGKGWVAAYNPAIPGSQPLTYIPNLGNGGLLTNSTVIADLQQNQAAALADLYVANRTLFPGAPAAFLPNPGIYAVDYGKNGGFSSFHSLQLEFNRRLAKGLQFQSNYTWGKLLTDSPTGDSAQTRFDPYLDNARPFLQKAPSDYDIRHVFHANAIYDLPFGKGKMFLGSANGLLDRLVGGWQLSSIFSLQSGSNFSITAPRGTFNRRTGYMTAVSSLTQSQIKKLMGTYIAPNGNVYFIDPRVTDPTNQNRAVPVDTLSQAASTSFNQVFFNATAGGIGNLGLLAFTGPAFMNVDAGLAKNTKITERVNFQLRLDAFNLPNHPTFAMLDTDINSTQFGRMTSTLTSSRRLQIGARIDF